MIRKNNRILFLAKILVICLAGMFMVNGIGDVFSRVKTEESAEAERSTVTTTAITNDETIITVQEDITKKEIKNTKKKKHKRKISEGRNLDKEEMHMLAKIAMAEAGNQDTEGKALVMLVVLNRVWGDNEFPDTIEEVLYQPKQFSPVMSGAFENIVPNKDCCEALKLVESGWDESQGALYFESKSSSTWHEENLKFLFKHGDHYFYMERD